MATYVNDLRLKEIATGDESGTWGTSTNTNLELIAEAFSFGTEAITTNADTHTTTIADGATDPGRSLFLKYTGTLDSACTITIGPNTVSKLWFIENATSGSQNIIISQGSGANITIPPGDTKAVYSDGAGSGAAIIDAFASLSVVDLKVQDDLTVTDDVAIGGLATVGGTLGVTGIVTLADDLIIGDGKTIGSASDVDAITIASNGQVTFTQTLIGTALDISGDIDVDGTTNLDVVDIDGAVDMASTLTVATRVGIGVAAHADDALNITTTDQHIRMNNGSELGIINLDSDGKINIWAHGDGETINLKTGTGSGTDVLSVVGTKVGIGESSPAATLHLDSAGVTAIAFDSNASTQQYEMGTGYAGVGSANNFYLYNNTASSAVLVANTSGNVGLGTTVINSTLSVGSTDDGATITSGGTNTHLQLKAMGSAGVIIFGAGGVSNGTAGTERMRIDASGNLLVGTTTANSKVNIHYSSAFGQRMRYEASTATVFPLVFEYSSSTVGSVSITSSATSYNTSSDQRLKENIADADDAGSKVDAIQVRKFDWKVDGSHQDYGMIAQELQTVAPEAVSAPEDPDEMMGVDYSKLVPMLVKEIQSLRARVAQLENS